MITIITLCILDNKVLIIRTRACISLSRSYNHIIYRFWTIYNTVGMSFNISEILKNILWFRNTKFNSQAPHLPELAHQAIFQLSRLNVNFYVKKMKKYIAGLINFLFRFSWVFYPIFRRDWQWNWNPMEFVSRDTHVRTLDWDWDWFSWDWEKYRWDSPGTKISGIAKSQALRPLGTHVPWDFRVPRELLGFRGIRRGTWF